MFIPSDTSDISDWEWIAGGFPCREMIRERFILDKFNFNEEPTSSLDPQTYQTKIKSEILDKQPQSMDPAECPISIKPAAQTTSHSPSKLSTTAYSDIGRPKRYNEGNGGRKSCFSIFLKQF